ncbi:hypothetical protein EAI_06651 [Harpegnathos saltator]|uniref:Uncharacterized protein n=1 Tax=Harpegnathos saltator TaxID=610380 RepID=E2BI01_HARSA|nr:hypothetical protein EAI_06651 [Harpegnathos saltator]
MLPSRSRLGLTGLGSSQDLGSSNGDLYYNSRPEGHWSYQPPPPPVITHQPKPSATQHFQPYERGYPKTLESLAEKKVVNSWQCLGTLPTEVRKMYMLTVGISESFGLFNLTKTKERFIMLYASRESCLRNRKQQCKPCVSMRLKYRSRDDEIYKLNW